MQKPILHVFLISHYCEKARWALDLAGVDYSVNLLSPLKHAKTAKRMGAKSSALPILQCELDLIQGSANIIAWANKQASLSGDSVLSITDESIDMEKRLDNILGVHVRRWFYSESIVDCPEIVKPVFAYGSGLIDRVLLSLAWPTVTATMIKRMDLGADQEIESRGIVEAELDWLDSLLVDGRPFLLGDSLSNADLAAASLMAPMFAPEAHPASAVLTLPPRAKVLANQWSVRPFAKWLNELYLKNR
ncbi:MAG: glutathione S-transferase [Oceanicoccus sp.]|jgi:glutathione S-transferase